MILILMSHHQCLEDPLMNRLRYRECYRQMIHRLMVSYLSHHQCLEDRRLSRLSRLQYLEDLHRGHQRRESGYCHPQDRLREVSQRRWSRE